MKLSNHELFPLYVDGAIDKNNAMKQCVGAFERHTIDTLEELYVMVASQDSVYAPIYWVNNHRCIKNAILDDIDLIIYDSDDGDTEVEICDMLKGVEFLLLRTAGWSEELEKYRIFIPLAQAISFETDEEYKIFYRWLSDLIGLHQDTSTNECGRGYIGVAGKEGVLQNGEKINPITMWDEHLTLLNKQKNRQKLKNLLNSKYSKKKNYNNNITPEHLINKMKFKEYLSNIYDGNYNNGIMAMIGYLKKCKCEKQDVEDWLIAKHFGNADTKYIQHRMKKW